MLWSWIQPTRSITMGNLKLEVKILDMITWMQYSEWGQIPEFCYCSPTFLKVPQRWQWYEVWERNQVKTVYPEQKCFWKGECVSSYCLWLEAWGLNIWVTLPDKSHHLLSMKGAPVNQLNDTELIFLISVEVEWDDWVRHNSLQQKTALWPQSFLVPE